MSVDDANFAEDFEPLRLEALRDLAAGHPAEDRPAPTDVRTPHEK